MDSKQRDLKVDGLTFSHQQMKVPESVDMQDWLRGITFAVWCRESAQWWVGDILVMGQQVWGDDFWQVFHSTGISIDNLERMRAVSEKVPGHLRRSELSWQHHALVANFAPHEQKWLLNSAVQSGLTSHEFQKHVAAYKRHRDKQSRSVR